MKKLYIVLFLYVLVHYSRAQTVLSGKGAGYLGQLNISSISTITVGFTDDHRTSIDLGNGTVFVLAQNRIVKEAKSSVPLNLALLLVFRVGDNGVGLWYENMLVIKQSNVSDAKTEFVVTEMMKADDLKRIDGRERSVQDVGDLTEFPTVSLRVATNRGKTLPTATDYNWENWNMVTGLKRN